MQDRQTPEQLLSELHALRQRCSELERALAETDRMPTARQPIDTEEIAKRQRAEEEIRRPNEDLTVLNLVNAAVNRGDSLAQVVGLVMSETQRIFHAYRATLYLVSEDGQYLILPQVNLPDAMLRRIEHLIGRSLPTIRIPLTADIFYQQLISAGKPRIVHDPEQIRKLIGDFAETTYLPDVLRKSIRALVPALHVLMGIRSVMSAPLISNNRPVGVLEVSSRQLFDDEDLRRLGMIAEQLTAVVARKRAEETLAWETRLKTALAELYPPLVAPFSSIEDIARIILRWSRELTDSEHGYVSSIDARTGEHVRHAVTEMLLDQRRVVAADRLAVLRPGDDGRYPGLWGHALNTREAFFTNSPAEHASSEGTPQGHVPLRNFLSVPVVLDEQLVGQIALANSSRPYSQRDLQAVGRVAEFYALAILRWRTQAELREERDKAQRYLDTADVMLVALDREGRITMMNRKGCSILGYDEGELVGKIWFDTCLPADLREGVRSAYQKLMSGPAQPLAYFERFVLTKSGEQRIIGWRNVLLSDAEGHVSGMLSSGTDVTERKRAEEEHRLLQAQVQHSQKLESLGVLAGGIAHDFNNLLTAILGRADLALHDLPPASSAEGHILELVKAARRAADISRQLLAYSGRGRFVVQVLDLNAAVRELSDVLQVAISKKAMLTLNLAPDLPGIEADPVQIQQVIMNLIINASEAIGDQSGVITLSTGTLVGGRPHSEQGWLNEPLPEGPCVYLEVADTGVGMDAATLSRLFEPFFTTKFTGRGLGLAAVLGIVRGHHGAIQVHSEPGQGTSFRLIFPAAQRPAESANPIPVLSEWRGSGTVLLADDEQMVRDLAQRMLERLGFRVLTASDGKQALQVFQANADEIVCALLDLTMPRMDGVETLRELHAIRADLPVLLSSGYDQADLGQRIAGAGGFVQKPYELAELSRKVEDLLTAGSGRGAGAR